MARASYTVVLQEAGDQGARWLYDVGGEAPHEAARRARREALRYGYGGGSVLAQVYDASVSGTTLGRTPLAEFTLEPVEASAGPREWQPGWCVSAGDVEWVLTRRVDLPPPGVSGWRLYNVEHGGSFVSDDDVVAHGWRVVY